MPSVVAACLTESIGSIEIASFSGCVMALHAGAAIGRIPNTNRVDSSDRRSNDSAPACDSSRRENRDVTRPPQTQASFLAELPALLQERSMSTHALAKLAGINHSHLSRAKRGKDYKTLSG